MGEASTRVHLVSLAEVTEYAGNVAALRTALERVEDDYQAAVAMRRERLAELVAPVPSEEALRRMGGER